MNLPWSLLILSALLWAYPVLPLILILPWICRFTYAICYDFGWYIEYICQSICCHFLISLCAYTQINSSRPYLDFESIHACLFQILALVLILNISSYAFHLSAIILDYEYIYLHVYYRFAIILILPQIYQWRYILPYWWFELSCFLISWKFILILAGAFILLYAYICFPSTSNMFVNTVGASILSYMRISVSVLLQISLPMLAEAFVLSFMHTYAWSACV